MGENNEKSREKLSLEKYQTKINKTYTYKEP